MKLVLQEASVIGREFACDILKRISRIREDIDEYLQDRRLKRSGPSTGNVNFSCYEPCEYDSENQ